MSDYRRLKPNKERSQRNPGDSYQQYHAGQSLESTQYDFNTTVQNDTPSFNQFRAGVQLEHGSVNAASQPDLMHLMQNISVEEPSEALRIPGDNHDQTLELSRISQPYMVQSAHGHRAKTSDLIDSDDQVSTVLQKGNAVSILTASYRYSVSHLSREKKEVFIGCSTVSMIVFITMFICVFL